MVNKLNEWKPYHKIKGIEVQGKGYIRRNYRPDDFLYPDIHYLTNKTDKDGRHYVITHDHGHLYVDELVATCFCHRGYGQDYVIHKNGNLGHDFYFNLEWVDKRTYREKNRERLTKVFNGIEYVWYYADIYISEKGSVLIGNLLQPLLNSAFDPDIDRDFAMRSFVLYDNERYFIDDMVLSVWNKVVDHIDGDFSNWSDDNLCLVDPKSKEADEIIKKRAEWVKTKDLKYEEEQRKAWENGYKLIAW